MKYIIEEAPEVLASNFYKILEESKGFIAGGVIRNYFEQLYHNTSHSVDYELTSTDKAINDTSMNVKPFSYITKDVDMFFYNQDLFKNFTDQHYDEDNIFGESYATVNSIGFHYNNDNINVMIDCVRKNFGTPDEIISMFDFTVTQAALFLGNEENGLDKNTVYLMYHPDFKNHIKNKILLFTSKSSRRQNIMERVERYWDYGYAPDENNSLMIIEAFLSKYPELSGFTVDEFVKVFSDEKNVFSKDVLKNIKREKTGRRKIMRAFLSYSNPARNSLINLLTMNSKTIMKSSESFSNHTSQERNYVRLVKTTMKMPEGFVNKKEKVYRKTVKDLGLPSSLNFRKHISNDIVEFHEFLIEHQSNIDKKKLHQLIDFVHSQVVVTLGKDRRFFCVTCSDHFEKPVRSLSDAQNEEPVSIYDKVCEHMSSYRLEYNSSDDWLEIIQKTFEKNPKNIEWIERTIDFFNEFSQDSTLIPTLSDFHEALDSDVFDPMIPPSMMMNLINSEQKSS